MSGPGRVAASAIVLAALSAVAGRDLARRDAAEVRVSLGFQHLVGGAGMGVAPDFATCPTDPCGGVPGRGIGPTDTEQPSLSP